MISLFLFLIFFFQTFNGNFDQNTVEKQILFSAFEARYLRFVVGSKHGGACLRVEVSGVPRRRGLIYCRNCSGFKEYSFLPSCGTFLRIIEKILFLFATTSALSFFWKILLKYSLFKQFTVCRFSSLLTGKRSAISPQRFHIDDHNQGCLVSTWD